MANQIILKRSSTAGKAPLVAQLALGEIAINTHDGKIYIKKDNGVPTVVEIGGVTSVNTQGGDVVLGTANIAETGSNQYFTTARARASIVAGSGISYNSTTGSVSTSQNLTTSGAPTFAGVTLTDTASTKSIVPSLSNTYDLGTVANPWRHVYVGPGSLYVNGKQVLTETSGTMTFTADLDQNMRVTTTGTGLLQFGSSSTGVNIDGTLQLAAGKRIISSDGVKVQFGDDVELNGNKVIGLGVPTANTDAATKLYVDSSISAISTSSIQQGNSSVQVVDSGTGIVTVTVDGTTALTVDSSGIVVTGNMTVNGTTTTVNSNTIKLADNIITLNSDAVGVPTQNAGIEVARGDEANVQLRWNEGLARWGFTNDGAVYYGIATGTDTLAEGTTNLYFTNGRARAAINASAGTGVSYNSASGAISLGSIPNTSLVNNSIVINGASVALGGTRTLAVGDIAGAATDTSVTAAIATAAADATAKVLVETNARVTAVSGAATTAAADATTKANAAQAAAIAAAATDATTKANAAQAAAIAAAATDATSKVAAEATARDTAISSAVAAEVTARNTAISTAVATKDNTDEITEGTTNLYFTAARAVTATASAVSGAVSTAAADATAKVLTETNARVAADTAAIATAASDATAKVAAEATARNTAISTSVAAEATLRTTADTTLQTNIDAKLASTSYTAADVLAKMITVDGAGSLLDADLLDGQQGAYYASAASVTTAVSTAAADATAKVLTETNARVAADTAAIATAATAADAKVLVETNARVAADTAAIATAAADATAKVLVETNARIAADTAAIATAAADATTKANAAQAAAIAAAATDATTKANAASAAAIAAVTNGAGAAFDTLLEIQNAMATDAELAAAIAAITNVPSATKLQTARTIQGVSFDGTAAITVATAGTGITVTGTTIATTITQYTDALATAAAKAAITATGPVVATAGVISMPAATTSVSGYLSTTDWNTFNGKQAALGFTPYNATNPSGYTANLGTVTSVTATGPVVSSGGTTPVISMPAATTSVSGYLAAADWNTFNGKQAALGFTPYNATNPAGYIVASSNTSGTHTGPVSTVSAVATGALTVTGAITATGEVTAYYSDVNLKKDIVEITDPIAKVMSLRGVTFRPNQTALDLGIIDKEEVGVIAQEVEAVLPQLVVPSAFKGFKTVKYDKLTALLLEAVKAQQLQIDALRAEISKLGGSATTEL